mgnify:CR=1 FL=1
MKWKLQNDRAFGVFLFFHVYRRRAGNIALETLCCVKKHMLVGMQLHIMRDRKPAGQRDHEHHDQHDTYELLSAFFHAPLDPSLQDMIQYTP